MLDDLKRRTEMERGKRGERRENGERRDGKSQRGQGVGEGRLILIKY